MRYARNDARGELRWSALGPLIEYVRTPELRDLRIRPLLWLTRRLGDTPQEMRLPAGRHRVRIERNGQRTVDELVTVRAGARTKLLR